MIRLYGLKNCDTCRKALKMLKANGFSVVFVDVRAEPLSPQDLARFQAEFGAALVNTRSTTWRGLDDLARAQDPLVLLAQNPALMKRPVIDRDGGLTLGWSKEIQAQYLAP